MMSAFKCLTNKNCSQVGEDERLDKGNHYFNQIDKYCKQNRHGWKSPTCNGIHRSENKNQCYKTQYDDVSSNHVCKKTYDQCEWFGENTQQFHRQHDQQFNNNGNTRIPEDMSPEMFIGTEENNKKRNHSKHNCESNVSGYIGRARQQSKNIIDQNEKENSEQVWKILVIFSMQVWFCNFISNESNNRF